MSQLVLTPVGTVSVFGFKTPVPYPFGAERTGYLVTDLDACKRALEAAGCEWRAADDLPGVRRGHTKDPFGNRIELVEAP